MATAQWINVKRDGRTEEGRKGGCRLGGEEELREKGREGMRERGREKGRERT